MAPYLTIAQATRRENRLPWKLTIAGRTDSISVAEILSAGKLAYSHKAFEILEFVVAAGGSCLQSEGGMYREAPCEKTAFSDIAKRLIGQLQPGHRLCIVRARLRNQAGQELLIDNQTFLIRPKS